MKRTFKTIISAALAGAFALSSFTGAYAVKYMGDLDGDGNVNSSDALTILKYVVGLETDEFDFKVADLDGDGNLTSGDALEILRTCVGQTELVEIKENENPEKPNLSTKQEIVDYYKKSLKDAYNSENVTVDKTETVAITLDSLKPSKAKSIADSLIKSNSAPKNNKKTFTSNAQEAEKFLVPNILEADGVAVATAAETETGYEISITLVEEKVDTKTKPKYNGQASLPLDLNSLGLSSLKVTSGGFEYPGTVITAKTDKSGKLLSLKHTMPLAFDATGDISFIKGAAATGHGTYTLDVTFAY